MEKRKARSPLIIDEKLITDVSIRAYENGMLRILDRAAPFIETLCKCYIEGRFDKHVTKIREYSKAKKTRSSHININIKNDVGIKAYHDRVISSPRYAVRVIELILKKYLYGDLDEALTKKMK